MTKGTLSLNKADVRCRISGLLRDAKGSPCVDEYSACPVWRAEKEGIWKSGKARKSSSMINAGSGTWE